MSKWELWDVEGAGRRMEGEKAVLAQEEGRAMARGADIILNNIIN